MLKRDRLYICHTRPFHLTAIETAISELFSVNPPHAARMPAAPRLTPRPRHFDGSPTQSLIHRVLQPGSDSSSLCTICLLLPSLHPSSCSQFFFMQLLSAFFLSATLFPHLVRLHAGHHWGQCVCVCVCWPGSCKRRQLRELTRCDSSGYLSLALTVDRWIPLSHCKE